MNKHRIPNPVTAIAEADATGKVAERFADIRQTMEIPLITSVWRILVDFDDGLESAWAITKPLYQSGQPQAALLKMRQEVAWPSPAPLIPSQLSCVGIAAGELPIILAIVDAYNRSNGLNLIALTALGATPSGAPANHPMPPSPSAWPQLPPLLNQEAIPLDTWTLLRAIYHLGSDSKKAGVATLWRHLAHWPGLLALIYAGLSPLSQTSAIQHTMQSVQEIARREGGRIAYLRPDISSLPGALPGALPDDVRDYITQYASNVHRMVTIGHIVAGWLQLVDAPTVESSIHYAKGNSS